MMFFPTGEELDGMWAMAKRLYRARQLNGIDSMKVSTAMPNPRSRDPNTGVIIFYCGPDDDEAAVKRYGRNLLRWIPYRKTMTYKADYQTMQGTGATGQRVNHLYKLYP